LGSTAVGWGGGIANSQLGGVADEAALWLLGGGRGGGRSHVGEVEKLSKEEKKGGRKDGSSGGELSW
jgi:hypothetical protein